MGDCIGSENECLISEVKLMYVHNILTKYISPDFQKHSFENFYMLIMIIKHVR